MPDSDAELPDHAEIARELIHLRSAVGAPALSPDGRHVATVVATVDLDENTTRTSIWLDGSPLTAGPTDRQPTWSPDGSLLAFASRRGDDKKATLHVMPVDGPGELRRICAMDDGLGDLAWSPDGRHLAFTSRTRDDRYDAKDVSWQSPRKIERFLSRLNGENWIFDRPQHVYVIAADGTGTPRNLTPGIHEFGSIAWTPDSTAIVTSGRSHDTWEEDLAEDLYLVPLDGDHHPLTRHTGLFSAPAVSPDGRSVAFIGMDDALEFPQNMKIGVVPIDGGAHRWISTGLDRSFFAMTSPQAPVWESDETLLAAAEDRGETHLYRLGVDGRDPERLTAGAISIQGYDTKQGVLATCRSTVRHGGELWLTGDDDVDRRITHVTSDLLDWEKFQVPCSDGSDEIDAWIMRPPDFDESTSYPVLLNVHGGPFTQYGEYFFDEAQMQAAAGFVVLMSNPRGGSGRHTAWGQAIMGPKHATAPGLGWGTVDVDDVMAVLDTALERYTFCDRERVGMLGGSYGGFMATTLAARYGDRFRGICSERSVNNMLTEEWSSDIATFFRSEHGPNPVEDPDEYLRMSPIKMAEDIHVPMLIIHSEEDFRCPINQAEELWVTLRLLKRDVTFYRFPGENHDLSRNGSPVHRRMRAEIILDWFADRLAAS